jgi:hypothetical protein
MFFTVTMLVLCSLKVTPQQKCHPLLKFITTSNIRTQHYIDLVPVSQNYLMVTLLVLLVICDRK